MKPTELWPSKTLTLMEQASRDPLGGIGKPEILKHLGRSYMLRRIFQEHRLVYRVAGKTIQFLSARFHYDKK
ncbi:Txe/YoeB family addiction module toxin [Hymenobacter sp. H14-R3]|uniref:Txe/YoeB family addiction module toxin n=1 Tax=Hymenobacter sp. H14-R3 TaxID=3046308 RepID=UPI0024BA517D|nr:Txe/YoeB family addiction module toxin [Hymenobacter sp. H14-R3]MDJ0366042.1 Txe/YoeB family addiction module toxin [Hymenobacter sp. H14-R3]